ncbi:MULTISPECIES: flagellar basal body P-ring protein FlgI [unclassified Endozoicomonas]|uniref:flagellar basal body P-ring protein FlgI n=2 Tax=Endozoicomonas TaxID=305899 RepID=UPI00214762B1|nr:MULTISPECIES: flagellar basal body P-ring protein FlgI [unclassified Endozoicomonas]
MSLTRWGLIFLMLVVAGNASARRLLDMVDVEGVRNNQLIGYGLVVGLDGTGDKSAFTKQSLVNMLREFGLTINSSDVNSKNIAAVTVHASLPPFARPGQKIDVSVSSIGDAKSLRGGTLLLTPMKGINGEVFAVAQGSLIVGGVSAEGLAGTADAPIAGSRIQINTTNGGRIPGGALVERSVKSAFNFGEQLVLNLKEPSYTNARRVVTAINNHFGPKVANASNGVSILVSAPRDSSQRVAFMSMLEGLNVETADPSARIIFNSRTGTVVMGEHVRVRPAAVSHGNLVVKVRQTTSVSQPGAFSQGGQTEAILNSDVTIEEQNAAIYMVKEGVTLQEVVMAINGVGATPTDLMSILEALKAAGALEAELIVI